MTIKPLAPLLLLALIGHFDLSAQWPGTVAPGTRVRVRLPEVQFQETTRRGHLLRGRVTTLSPDTLYLAVTDSVGPLAVPRSLIEKLDLSRGVPSRGASALRQGLISAALSALTLVLINEAWSGTSDWDTGEAALIGAGVGFASGAIVGAIFPRERWKSVRVSSP
jgi:hypothetical protein